MAPKYGVWKWRNAKTPKFARERPPEEEKGRKWSGKSPSKAEVRQGSKGVFGATQTE